MVVTVSETAEGPHSTCHTYNGTLPLDTETRIVCDLPARGQFVRLTQPGYGGLGLCEVKVFGDMGESTFSLFLHTVLLFLDIPVLHRINYRKGAGSLKVL